MGASLTLSVGAQAQAPAPKPLPPGLIEAIRFTIAEIRIEGNTLVPAEGLQESVKPFLGSGKRLDDLNGARRAIVEAYRAQGYELLSVTYDAPRSRGGTHYFVVHEVRIGKVRVTGNKAIAEEELRRQLPSLREGETPRLDRIARELFLFNDNPGHAAVLDYASGGPGRADVEVKVLEQPQRRTIVTLNNTGTNATGQLRAGLIWSDFDFFSRGHQLTTSVTTSPERRERVFVASLGYVIPLPFAGDSLSFGASYSDVDSGRVADLFNVSGKGTIWNVRYARNLLRSAESRHTLDIGYDERRYRDLVDFFGTNLGVSVTAKPISLGYRYSEGSSREGVLAGVALQQNVPGGPRNDDATYGASRAGGRARWRSWQFDTAWQRELVSGWSPSVRVTGQYSSEPLIAAEQFGLGGIHAVRGFNEREGAGDRGWRGSLELYGPRFASGQRLLGFVDVGRSSRLNAQPGEQAGEGVSSFGIGWRAQMESGLQIAVDAAKVADGTLRHPRGARSLHFAAAWRF